MYVFEYYELIKVCFVGDCYECKELVGEIENEFDCVIVGLVGVVVILYCFYDDFEWC